MRNRNTGQHFTGWILQCSAFKGCFPRTDVTSHPPPKRIKMTGTRKPTYLLCLCSELIFFDSFQNGIKFLPKKRATAAWIGLRFSSIATVILGRHWEIFVLFKNKIPQGSQPFLDWRRKWSNWRLWILTLSEISEVIYLIFDLLFIKEKTPWIIWFVRYPDQSTERWYYFRAMKYIASISFFYYINSTRFTMWIYTIRRKKSLGYSFYNLQCNLNSSHL